MSTIFHQALQLPLTPLIQKEIKQILNNLNKLNYIIIQFLTTFYITNWDTQITYVLRLCSNLQKQSRYYTQPYIHYQVAESLLSGFLLLKPTTLLLKPQVQPQHMQLLIVVCTVQIPTKESKELVLNCTSFSHPIPIMYIPDTNFLSNIQQQVIYSNKRQRQKQFGSSINLLSIFHSNKRIRLDNNKTIQRQDKFNYEVIQKRHVNFQFQKHAYQNSNSFVCLLNMQKHNLKDSNLSNFDCAKAAYNYFINVRYLDFYCVKIIIPGQHLQLEISKFPNLQPFFLLDYLFPRFFQSSSKQLNISYSTENSFLLQVRYRDFNFKGRS
eukprot:TRINITY_DN4569_c0_g1_i8.p1 TRINITY_DN4569_c0_g1~~TRINITY_DN4569_c0_g1_i8.p1  ORF type:complete len:325 (+),score=-28.85 TRINITY_DN4569_c0_g1_i8:414-1388(+)